MNKFNCSARVRGKNTASFLSSVNNNGIALTDIKTADDGLTFSFDSKHENELRSLSARSGLYFEIVRRKNAKTFVRGIVRHVGAIAALVAVTVTFIASRFFVFGIAVEGVTGDKAAEIISSLSEAGIDGVVPKSRIDVAKIQEFVSESSENIAFAEVYIDGVRLVINVREQLPEHAEEIQQGEIFASSDAIVTRVEVSGGTALVKAGDTVKKGQTLIEDYIIVGDPSDPGHKEIQTAAKGDVYGRVWYFERLIIPEYRTEYVRTGKEYTSSALYIKDKCLLKANASHGFQEYESVTKQTGFNAILPFDLVKTTYYEVQKTSVKTDDAYIESQIFAAFARLQTELDSSANVVDSYKSQKKVDNLYIINIYYEVEQLISCREA